MLGVTNTKEQDRRNFLDNMMQVFHIIMKRMFKPHEFMDYLYCLSPDFWLERRLLKDVHKYIDSLIQTKKIETESSAEKPSFLLDILWGNKEKSRKVDDEFIKDQVNVMVGGVNFKII